MRGTRRGQGRRARNVDQRPPFSIRPHVILAFPLGHMSFRLSHQAARSGFPIRLHVVPAFPSGCTLRLSHQATRSGFPTRLHVPAFLPGYTSFPLLLTRGWKSKDNVMTTFREQVLHIAKNDTGNWFTQHLKMMTPVGLQRVSRCGLAVRR